MGNTDLLSEIENEFDMVKEEDRSPDITFSGSGNGYSEPVEGPGGLVIVHLKAKDTGHYTFEAVGESVKDVMFMFVENEKETLHKSMQSLGESTYIFSVEADPDAEWEVEVYFSSPELVELPIETSGRGHDLIGPFAHSGFIELSLTNYHTDAATVGKSLETGQTWGQCFWVEGTGDKNGKTGQKLESTKNDRDIYPWIYVESPGEWDLTITPN